MPYTLVIRLIFIGKAMLNKLLVLEESNLVLELFQSALPEEDWGWKVLVEKTPSQFLATAAEAEPDIILLSNQDAKNDYAILKALQADPLLSSISVLLLTSARDRVDEEYLQGLGAAGFIRKPFEFSTLEDHLNRLMAEQGREVHIKEQLDAVELVDPEVKTLLHSHSEKLQLQEVSLEEVSEELDPSQKFRTVPSFGEIEPIDFSEELDEEDLPLEVEEEALDSDLPLEETSAEEPDLFAEVELSDASIGLAEDAALSLDENFQESYAEPDKATDNEMTLMEGHYQADSYISPEKPVSSQKKSVKEIEVLFSSGSPSPGLQNIAESPEQIPYMDIELLQPGAKPSPKSPISLVPSTPLEVALGEEGLFDLEVTEEPLDMAYEEENLNEFDSDFEPSAIEEDGLELHEEEDFNEFDSDAESFAIEEDELELHEEEDFNEFDSDAESFAIEEDELELHEEEDLSFQSVEVEGLEMDHSNDLLSSEAKAIPLKEAEVDLVEDQGEQPFDSSDEIPFEVEKDQEGYHFSRAEASASPSGETLEREEVVDLSIPMEGDSVVLPGEENETEEPLSLQEEASDEAFDFQSLALDED